MAGAAMNVVPYDQGADLCEDMECIFLVRQEQCRDSATCPRLDAQRMQRGSIYLVRPDGDAADFVGMLPRRRRS